MSVSTLTRPISVEQVATIIKQMSQVELQRLLYLVPNLEQKPAKRPTRTLEQAQASVEALWAEIKADPNYKPIPRDTPFLGGYTLGEFLALPDDEQNKIWDEEEQKYFVEPEEVEVRADAIPVR